jgi:hypothetical protein
MIYVFVLAYFGFLFGYPLLQLWTLMRCSGWWRAFALFSLVPAGPLYAWSLMYLLYPSAEGLEQFIVAFVGILPLAYLTVVALGFEAVRKHQLAVAKTR